MKKHLMIDIEALGQKPGCAIFELGAVVFDLDTGECGPEFHALIEPDNGVHEPETVEWHKAKGTYPMPGQAARVSAGTAFAQFNAWFGGLGPLAGVWSWGATYDFPVLDAIWNREGPAFSTPWKFYQEQCARTVCRLAFGPEWRHGPRPHKALEDAKAAVGDLVRGWASLRNIEHRTSNVEHRSEEGGAPVMVDRDLLKIGYLPEAMGLTLYSPPGEAGKPREWIGIPPVFAEVYTELLHAMARFPGWPLDPLHALGVVTEEYGELGKEVLQLVYEPHKSSKQALRKEAVQLAAMACRFIMGLGRYKFEPGVQYDQELFGGKEGQEG